MREYGFSLARILLYKDNIFDSVLIWGNTSQIKSEFWRILRNMEDWCFFVTWFFRPPLGKQAKIQIDPKIQPDFSWWKSLVHEDISKFNPSSFWNICVKNCHNSIKFISVRKITNSKSHILSFMTYLYDDPVRFNIFCNYF